MEKKQVRYWGIITILAVVIYAIVSGLYIYGERLGAEHTQTVFLDEFKNVAYINVNDKNGWSFMDDEPITVNTLDTLVEVYCNLKDSTKDDYMYFYVSEPFFNLIQSGINSLRIDCAVGETIDLDELQKNVDTLRTEYAISYKLEESEINFCGKGLGALAVLFHLFFAFCFRDHF